MARPEDEYGEQRQLLPEEFDYDGTPVVRPSSKVYSYDPEKGYVEPATTDVEAQGKRIQRKNAEIRKNNPPKK